MHTLRRRVSVIVLHKNKILGFHAEDPTSKKKYFFLPGGVPEEGESLGDTAKREALEETGFDIEVSSQLQLESHYEFEWDGKSYYCQTRYFLGQLKADSSTPVLDAPYHRGMDWQPILEIDQVFSYHPEILKLVKAFTGS